jgi:hypothetical protein
LRAINPCSLEFQTGFARGVGQRLDATMENITAAIKYHSLNTLCFGTLGNQLAFLKSASSVDAAAIVLPA